MTFPELLDYIKIGGMPAVFATLWWLERTERISCQAELRQVSEKSITAITEMKALVGQLAVIFKPNGNG